MYLIMSNDAGKVIVAAGLYALIPEIKQLLCQGLKVIQDIIFTTLVIKKSEFLSYYAIVRELDRDRDIKLMKAMDSGCCVSYTTDYGTYFRSISYNGNKIRLVISFTESEIKLYTLSTPEALRSCFDAIYKKFNSADTSIIYFISDGAKWGSPLHRRPRSSSNLTNCMQTVLDDVADFQNSADQYSLNSYPYRKGYLVHGPPGTGKSSIVEMIAKSYNMQVYSIQLNNVGMNDASLIKLCASVPINSIIVFDEIDKQYESIINNDRVHVSTSGLLCALDGVPKLPYGTIVIMTCNSLEGFQTDFLSQLTRRGRIDCTFELSQKFE